MVKHFDLASFELFQILNCTVRTPVSSCGKLNELLIPTQTPPQTPTSGGSPGSRSGKDSDSRSGKENESRSGKENDREIDCISNLDKDKMMAHILDCLSALKRVDELHHDDDKEKTQLAAVKGRVFRKAIDLIMRPKSADRRNPDLEIILQSFPDGTKLQDDRKWLSLHWAVLEDANIDQDDIEILYSADPMALTRHHLKHITDILPQGYTPAHLISFQKHPTMPLVRFLDIHSPRAFLFPSRGLTERRSRYPVQIAAAFTESIDFLQLLLQLQPGAPKLGLGSNSTPLCELIKRENYDFESFPVLLKCLLSIDSSAEIIDEVIRGLIQKLGSKREKSGTLLSIFEILLNTNSRAAFVVDSHGRQLLHHASKYLKNVTCATDIIKALLLVHNDAASLVDNDECYAITTAAQYSTVEIVKLLYDAYPDSTKIDENNPKRNLIHNGLYNEVDKNMMKFLCANYPDALHGYSQDRKTPLHELCYQHADSRFRCLKTMCEVDSSIVRKGCGAGSNRLGIPLHLLIIGDAKLELRSTISDAADCFRYLLKLYPESAGIRDVDGNTAYTLAVILHMKSYFVRLLLRADVTIDPAVLRCLNYKERRGAMFLAFSAVSSNKRPSLFALLRKSNMNLLEIVFSYL